MNIKWWQYLIRGSSRKCQDCKLFVVWAWNQGILWSISFVDQIRIEDLKEGNIYSLSHKKDKKTHGRCTLFEKKFSSQNSFIEVVSEISGSWIYPRVFGMAGKKSDWTPHNYTRNWDHICIPISLFQGPTNGRGGRFVCVNKLGVSLYSFHLNAISI